MIDLLAVFKLGNREWGMEKGNGNKQYCIGWKSLFTYPPKLF